MSRGSEPKTLSDNPLEKLTTEELLSRTLIMAAHDPQQGKERAEIRRRLEEGERLRQALESLLPIVEEAVPQCGHDGACGPEAGCDGICMEVAAIAETLREARAALDQKE